MKANQIPNLLTGLRILLVAPLLMALLSGDFRLAVLIFCIAGFTDGLDGFLARSMNWRTRIGALLDPAADKIIMVTTFITLAIIKLVPLWLAVAVIARDLVIVIGAGYYRLFVGPFEGIATPASKLNTAMQLLFVLCVMLRAAFGLPPADWVLALGAIMFVTTVISGLDYVRIGVTRARQNANKERDDVGG